MKRYLLFTGAHYYASGGAMDYVGSFDTIEEAQAAPLVSLKGYGNDWAHIADSEADLAIVRKYNAPNYGHRDEGWHDPE